jgi:hypothetical protein
MLHFIFCQCAAIFLHGAHDTSPILFFSYPSLTQYPKIKLCGKALILASVIEGVERGIFAEENKIH